MKLQEKKTSNKKKGAIGALILFSGGLDSILAVKILEKQGIKVTALAYVSYFFDGAQAAKSARENNIKLIIRDFSKKHFHIVKKPCFGYGSGMNPCIDCHLLMLKAAEKTRRQEGYDFLATGEVLGQRPMSQNLHTLKLIEKKANLEGKILRPLSAKLLLETQMEKSGIVDREKLLGISGRSRKEQIALAKKFGIKNYPTPAGGCILTNKAFSQKLKELISRIKILRRSDLDLLRVGRHFWIGNTKIILGRNHEENLKLKKLAGKGDILIEPKNVPGPTAILRGKIKAGDIKKAKEKILFYIKRKTKQLSLRLGRFNYFFVPMVGVEPTSLAAHDFESCVFASFTTSAFFCLVLL